MSTYFRAVSRSGRQCPRLRCGEHGSSCAAGTSPVFSTDESGCPICTCRQLTAFLRPSTSSCPPLDCSHLVCVGPVRFSSRLVGHCPVCECVPIDDETAAAPASTVTSSPCPELDCSDHFRCHGGRKLDPQTGCETCECNADDCADCAAVCANSEPTRCTAVCGCEVVDKPPCRPLPIDCEFRVGCVLGTDADGCEVCRCTGTETSTESPSTPACPQTTCQLTCAGTGYAVDENGCRLCACASGNAETTTTVTSSSTSCVPVDCECPAEFDVVSGDDGCRVCICEKPEAVADSEDDVTKPPCACASNDCPGGADCESCRCPSAENSRQNDANDDVTAAARCEPMSREKCDDSCVVAVDDAGCQFCLCDDRVPGHDTQTELTDDRTTTAADATPKNADDDACENLFVCHPICEAVRDTRGCVVECRCDDVVSSLEDMQRQQLEPPPEVVADSDPQVMCSTSDSGCACGVDEEELWTVDVDGCLTCTCVAPSTTASDIPSTSSEYVTSPTTTTARPSTPSTTPSTPSTTDTTTRMTTSTTTITTPSTSQEATSSTVASTTTTVTSSTVDVGCRQLSDGDCAGVTCGDVGYAKDETGCDTCSCAVEMKEKEPTETVYQVVAAARKGIITKLRKSDSSLAFVQTGR